MAKSKQSAKASPNTSKKAKAKPKVAKKAPKKAALKPAQRNPKPVQKAPQAVGTKGVASKTVKKASTAPAAKGKKPEIKPSVGAKSSKPAPAKSAKAPGKPTAKATNAAAATKPTAPGKPSVTAKAAEQVEVKDAGAAGKKGPKGITIVNPKQVKKNKPKIKLEMPKSEPLIKPGTKWKPLIPSGPKAPPSPYGVWRSPDAVDIEEFKIDPKAKLPKKDLERFREILLRKRAELLGDITGMENEALRANSGSLSNLPQHMAEQGSDTYDQHLSLDLAAVDRTIIREIDEALKRIDEGTFGVCMKTGKRINLERLAEIPWARYSIDAARMMERNTHTVSSSQSEDHSSSSDMD